MEFFDLFKEAPLTPEQEKFLKTAQQVSSRSAAGLNLLRVVSEMYFIKHLEKVADKTIASNENLAEANNRHARAMRLLTGVLAVVAVVQMSIGIIQYRNTSRELDNQKTAHWGELRNAMWGIVDLTNPSEHGLAEIADLGYDAFRGLRKQEMVSWLKSALRILDSQITNPVLIESKTCLGYWRNAISTARTNVQQLRATTGRETEDAQKQRADKFVKAMSSISRDVLFVWGKIVLDSDEVSATGDRPKPQ